MITQAENRSCRRRRGSLSQIAIGAIMLAMSGCAEIELGAEAYKTYARAYETPPAAPGPAPPDSIAPSLPPAPAAFPAPRLPAWHGAPTLPRLSIAHPMPPPPPRLRLRHPHTGGPAPAARFPRGPPPSLPSTVRVRRPKGGSTVAGRSSDSSLYRHDLATYDAGDSFDQGAAPGFIHLYGLPTRTQAEVQGDADA